MLITLPRAPRPPRPKTPPNEEDNDYESTSYADLRVLLPSASHGPLLTFSSFFFQMFPTRITWKSCLPERLPRIDLQTRGEKKSQLSMFSCWINVGGV